MRLAVRAWPQRLKGRYLVAFLLIAATCFVYYLWRLSSLTVGLGPAEVTARASSRSWHQILLNPVNLPQRLLQLLAQKVGYHEAFSMRLASVIIAVLLVGCVFWLMKAWFGLTAGTGATLIFATTPLVVLLARSATGDVMLLMPAAVLAAYVRLARRRQKTDWAWLSLIALAALALYVPGVAWLVAGGLIFRYRQIMAFAKAASRWAVVLSVLLALVIITPLVWALVQNPNIYHSFLLVPAHWDKPLVIVKSLAWAALSLVWRTPLTNPLTVGHLAVLDGVQICLLVFGAYVMWTRARNEMLLILAMVAFSVVVSGLNHNVLLLALGLPGLAVLIGAGLRYLYMEWRTIFPKNPIPLGFALTIIIVLVGLQMAYGLRYSLIAWPHTAATKQTYVLK